MRRTDQRLSIDYFALPPRPSVRNRLIRSSRVIGTFLQAQSCVQIATKSLRCFSFQSLFFVTEMGTRSLRDRMGPQWHRFTCDTTREESNERKRKERTKCLCEAKSRTFVLFVFFVNVLFPSGNQRSDVVTEAHTHTHTHTHTAHCHTLDSGCSFTQQQLSTSTVENPMEEISLSWANFSRVC